MIFKLTECGNYKVSEYGDIYSLERIVAGKSNSQRLIKAKKLKLSLDSSGYLKCSICNLGTKKTINIHKIVVKLFVGTSDLTINHIDGNKLNNHYKNLEYITHEQNIAHAHKIGIHKNKHERIKDKRAIFFNYLNNGFSEKESMICAGMNRRQVKETYKRINGH